MKIPKIFFLEFFDRSDGSSFRVGVGGRIFTTELSIT